MIYFPMLLACSWLALLCSALLRVIMKKIPPPQKKTTQTHTKNTLKRL
jgi:hypothetical protein